MRRPLALILMIALVALSGCVAHWSAYPKNVPSDRRCQSMKSFPQLVQIPGFSSAWQLIHECTVPSEKTAIAMQLFLHEWEEEFGRSRTVRTNLNAIMIEWSRQNKGGGGYAVDGSYISSATFSGLTISKGTIWVKIKDNTLVCESSLVHELLHASIWALKKTDGDPDHLGDKYVGWTIRHQLVMQRTNEKLCRLGI